MGELLMRAPDPARELEEPHCAVVPASAVSTQPRRKPLGTRRLKVREVKVKVCGLTDAGDARLAVELGAAMLGFNFYPRSPRYIAPAQARPIIAAMPAAIEAVGVFVNATLGRDCLGCRGQRHRRGSVARRRAGGVLPAAEAAASRRTRHQGFSHRAGVRSRDGGAIIPPMPC